MTTPVWLLVIAFIFIEMPWLVERNTRERKILLDMLRELALETWAWERHGVTCSHKDSGVSFRMEGWRYHLMAGQVVVFKRDTKGGRICQRIADEIANEEKRLADLEALKGMTEAFNRMNATP